MIKKFVTAAAMAALLAVPVMSQAGVEEAKKWVGTEFQPSTLSQTDQMKEMEWFIKAAEPFKGMEINVVSETTLISIPLNGSAALMNHSISFICASLERVEG